MKKYLLLTLFLVIILSFIYSQDNKSDPNMIKRTVLIMDPVYLNDNKNYKFIGNLIRDSIRAKLFSKDNFYFSKFDVIDNTLEKMKTLSKNPKDVNFGKDVALLIGANVIINSKFSVVNNKIMITCEAYDILTDDVSVSETINGDLGPDIFDYIDEISENMSDKVAATFTEIDKIKLEKFMSEQTKKVENQIVIEKQNPVTEKENAADIIKLKYSGLAIKSNYNLIDLIVKGTNFEKRFVKKDKQNKFIVVKGCFNSLFPSSLTILHFQDEILSNIWILVSEINDSNKDTVKSNILDILKKDLGGTQSIDNNYSFESDDISLELTEIQTSNKRNFLFIHGFVPDNKIAVDEIINDPENQTFSKAINFTIGLGHFTAVELKWANPFILEKRYITDPWTGELSSQNGGDSTVFLLGKFNFNIPISLIFVDKRSYFGLLLDPGYSATILNSPDWSKAIYAHSFTFDVSFKHRFNMKPSDKNIVFEYGIYSEFDIFSYNNESEYIIEKTNANRNNYSFTSSIYSNMYFGFGPILSLNWEFHNNNISNVIGFFLGGAFGFDAINLNSNYYYKQNSNLITGFLVRFNYYNFTIIK